MIIRSNEMQNNFDFYLQMVDYEEIIVIENGKKKAKFVKYNEEDDILNEGTPEFIAAGVKMTYEEFTDFYKKTDKRYEFIDGEVFLLASPLLTHQKVVMNLLSILIQTFKDKVCAPFSAPFDIHLKKSEDNICVVQPDIMVICDLEDVINEEDRYLGTPSLVMEVVSKWSLGRDSINKLGLYMQSGIEEYWIINPLNKEITVYFFNNETIEIIETFRKGENATSFIYQELDILVDDIFDI